MSPLQGADDAESADAVGLSVPVVVVSANEICKTWSASARLAPLSFTLAAGDRVVVCGRSGSGKSTLLGLLAGWCEPDTGTITRVGSWAADDRWRRWVGTAIVPQTLGLLAELPIRENIALGLRLSGMRRRVVADLTAEMIEALDLVEEAGRLPADISLGQCQRASVARAVVSSPTLLLADEPTCHQDAVHAAMVLAALACVATAGGAVVLASHDEAIFDFAEKIISLD